MIQLKHFHSNCSYYNDILNEASLELSLIPLPPRAVWMLHHDLDNDDLVPHRALRLSPSAFRRGIDEGGNAAEFIG
jgi:hypothetical protein